VTESRKIDLTEANIHNRQYESTKVGEKMGFDGSKRSATKSMKVESRKK
jgi:hypothetical protein